MNNQIKIDLIPTGGELTIRTGNAAPIVETEKFEFSGLIDAPAIFYVNRCEAKEDYFNLEKSVVMVDLSKRTIQLITDVEDPKTDDITGTIFGESLLPPFKINTGNSWSPLDLAKFLKRNKVHFESLEVNANVVAKLSKLKVQTNGEISIENDNRGNKEQTYSTRTTSEIPESFVLCMPIFSNGQKQSFKVDIQFDVQGSTVLVFLESDDLYQMTIDGIKAEMEKQLDVFKDSGIPILYK